MTWTRLAGGPTTIRRRAVNRVLLALPVAARRRGQYLLAHGRLPHLDPPRTWNEKITWRMVHDRRELIAMTCDKRRAQEHVVASGVDVRVPRTVWWGDDVAALADLDWPAHWVCKPNHGTGEVVFGHGRPSSSGLTDLQRRAAGWIADRGLARWGEWGYGVARPAALVEEAVPGAPDTGLTDYKFVVVGGRVRVVSTDTDRFAGHRRRFYTRDWQALPHTNSVPLGPVAPRPAAFDRMVAVAEELGAPFDAVRVDLYHAAGQVWFGELTAYSGSGLCVFDPPALDAELGADWVLPADVVSAARRGAGRAGRAPA